MITTNEVKKDYLRRYLESKRREDELNLAIVELETRYGLRSPALDGMPRGSGGTDLSAFGAKYDKIHRQLVETLENSLTIYAEIYGAIESSEMPEDEKRVLRYRYIHGYTWERIAVTMEYSYQWICELHGRALQKFRIPSGT